jgi:hypothetical protein
MIELVELLDIRRSARTLIYQSLKYQVIEYVLNSVFALKMRDRPRTLINFLEAS